MKNRMSAVVGVVLTALSALLLPAVAQAAPAAPRVAIGYLDLATVRGIHAEVRGWTLDLARPSASSTVEVTVTGSWGTTRQRFSANRTRPDVNAAMKVTGDHGFVLQVPLAGSGSQRVCVSSISSVATTADAGLGCIDAQPVAGSPVGFVDSIRGGWMAGTPGDAGKANNGYSFKGWATDPSAPGTPLAIRVEDTAPSGKVYSSQRLSGALRPDVAAAVPTAGASAGFDVIVAVAPEVGAHTLCVYAVNVGTGADTNLACYRAVVAANPPIGSIDSLTQSATGIVDVTGWAVDPTSAGTPALVEVVFKKVTGVAQGGFRTMARESRPDVAAAYPGAGEWHGFSSFAQTYEGGTYTACLRATWIQTMNFGVANCTQFVVPDVIGTIDSVVTTNQKVTVTGWTFDPAHPDAALGIYGITGINTSGWFGKLTITSRPDIAALYKTGNNHGFEFTFTRAEIPVGSTVCFRVATDVRVKGIDCRTF